jgi:hypothetical protein
MTDPAAKATADEFMRIAGVDANDCVFIEVQDDDHAVLVTLCKNEDGKPYLTEGQVTCDVHAAVRTDGEWVVTKVT